MFNLILIFILGVFIDAPAWFYVACSLAAVLNKFLDES